MANYETILAQTQKSYDASRDALNKQIANIDTQLATNQEAAEKQYAQQASQLKLQQDYAARQASAQAAGSGGSFGGMANLANRKYYEQTYVPAVTQMQTNKANTMSSLQQQANDNRLSLQSTLAQMEDQATQAALARYDAAVQAERDEAYRQAQLKLQRQQIAAQNAYNNYLVKAAQQQQKNAIDTSKLNANDYINWLNNGAKSYFTKQGNDWYSNQSNLNNAAALVNKYGFNSGAIQDSDIYKAYVNAVMGR